MFVSNTCIMSVDNNDVRWNKDHPSMLDLAWHDSASRVYKFTLWSTILATVNAILFGSVILRSGEGFFIYIAAFSFCASHVLLVCMGVLGTLAVVHRRPDTLFLCRAFFWYCLSDIVLLIVAYSLIGVFPSFFLFIWVGFCIVALITLYSSDELCMLFPREYRRFSIFDLLLSAGCFATMLLFYILFFIDIYYFRLYTS